MKDNEKLSEKLKSIITNARKLSIENDEKNILLETVVSEIMSYYSSDSSINEDKNILREYIQNTISERISSKTRFINHINKLTQKSRDNNKAVPELKDKLGSLVCSPELDDVILRAAKLTELFELGDEISVELFFFAALKEENNPIIKYILDSGFDIEKLISNLCWNCTNSDTSEGVLKEKLIKPGDSITDKNPNEKTNSNKDDDFQAAGQRGSIRTKEIDPDSTTPFLDEFAFDMTEAAKEGKYDPVVGRDREVGSLIEILACRKKNNAILLGEPGCGKTSVVEALVDRISSGKVPYELKNKRVVSLDLNALVAGAIYRGEYEKRLQGIIKEVVETKNIIVFIDEVHNLIGNGSSSGQGDGANILKPYLARGEFQIIGATTKTEYRVIEKDGALKRRFQNVVVEDPDIKETVNILETVADKYSEYHRVKYTPEVLAVCAKWSDKYISDRHQPDKSIDIMDMAGSLCKLRVPHDTTEEDNLEKEIQELIEKKIKAVEDQDFDKGTEYRSKEKELKAKLLSLRNSGKDDDVSKWPVVTLDDVADVISKITNIPVDKVKSTDTAKIQELRESLLTNIIGQDEAIEKVVKTLQLGVLGIRDPKRPLCSFLLCGPSGVGKTYLAKLLAKYYYGNENAIVRINMGEMDEHSKSRLLGSQPGTIGYDEPTPFDDLATRPASVVLLDEVEKADAKIFDIILNAIGEEGYITLNNGKDISFRQSIVILTSNIGTRELQDKGEGLGFSKLTGEDKKKSDSGTVMKAIKKFFRPEFINRLTGISVFNELSKEDMLKIFDLELEKMNKRTEESGHIIHISDAVKENIIAEVDTKFGARDLTRKIMELVSNNVCEEMIKAGKKAKKNIYVDLDKKKNIKIKFKED